MRARVLVTAPGTAMACSSAIAIVKMAGTGALARIRVYLSRPWQHHDAVGLGVSGEEGGGESFPSAAGLRVDPSESDPSEPSTQFCRGRDCAPVPAGGALQTPSRHGERMRPAEARPFTRLQQPTGRPAAAGSAQSPQRAGPVESAEPGP